MVAVLTAEKPKIIQLRVDSQPDYGFVLHVPPRSVPVGYKTESLHMAHGLGYGPDRTTQALLPVSERGVHLFSPYFQHHHEMLTTKTAGSFACDYPEKVLLASMQAAYEITGERFHSGGSSWGGFENGKVHLKYELPKTKTLHFYSTPYDIRKSARTIVRRVIRKSPGWVCEKLIDMIRRPNAKVEDYESDTIVKDVLRENMDDYHGNLWEFAELVRYFLREKLPEGEFRVPTIIIYGDKDILLDHRSQLELYLRSPEGSEMHLINGGRHGLLDRLEDDVIPLGISFSEKFMEPVPAKRKRYAFWKKAA